MFRAKWVRILGATSVPFLFWGCMGDARYGALGAACPQMTGSMDPLDAHYSASAHADTELKAFVAATRDLIDASMQIETETMQACQRMGLDLGIDESAMRPSTDEPGAQAQAACAALAQRIDAILRAGAGVRVSVAPPACSADLQGKARCSGACTAEVDPGEIVARCEPGKLAGQCVGTCGGGCEGTCQGECEGQCSARDASGKCAGHCSGTCHGSCDATCHARCEGQWQAPRCEGHVRAPSADAQCEASCNARAEIRAQCTPARVTVQASRSTADVARLGATLQANLPLLFHAERALGVRLTGSAETLARIGGELPNVLGDAGEEAMACTAAAADATLAASARIRVSVQASASISGRIGAGT